MDNIKNITVSGQVTNTNAESLTSISLSELHKSIEEANATFDKISNKLKPILLPDNLEESRKEPVGRVTTDLSRAIDLAADKINNLSRVMRGIDSRIDL